jgi:hypothetical protein
MFMMWISFIATIFSIIGHTLKLQNISGRVANEAAVPNVTSLLFIPVTPTLVASLC